MLYKRDCQSVVIFHIFHEFSMLKFLCKNLFHVLVTILDVTQTYKYHPCKIKVFFCSCSDRHDKFRENGGDRSVPS